MSLEEPLAPAAALIRRLEPELMANVFRWTGPLPRADPGAAPLPGRAGGAAAAGLRGRRGKTTAIVALTTLVTGLAMNYVQRGSYLP